MENTKRNFKPLLIKYACPEIFSAFSKYFMDTGQRELLERLEGLVIPSQALFGNPDSFRFTVVRSPELSMDEASLVAFRDWENVGLTVLDGYAEVQFDNFGRMELFYISKLPLVFSALLKFEGYIGPPFANVFPSAEA